MCGIFGIIQKEKNKKSGRIFSNLCLLSESRGKEAAGFAVHKFHNISVFKTPYTAGDMIKTRPYKEEIVNVKTNKQIPFIAIGHSRLVTNGYEQFDINNQPVVKNGFLAVHNGIIVNQAELWNKYGTDTKISDLDSELIPTILDYHLKIGSDMGFSLNTLFEEIYGMTNIALLFSNLNNLILATNNGSLYYLEELDNGIFIFASEKFILEKVIINNKIDHRSEVHQLNPREYICVNFEKFSAHRSNFGESLKNLQVNPDPAKIEWLTEKTVSQNKYINTSLEHHDAVVPDNILRTVEQRRASIDKLKRCKKCILPETFPFIAFDEEGTCNYCNSYEKHDQKGKNALRKIAESHRRKDGRPECLMPFSGGRDSSFALHYVVKELGLKPIAYSYDWGMITDLARRNQARMCGKLGVEHILVSADIREKRSNIRKNVLAWLKNPDLGTVPLFMAGDKQYFYFANQLMKQNHLNLSILGENLLETTNFKSGFCGVKPHFGQKHTYSLSLNDRIKMVSYYGKEFILNPSYINSSLFDTLDAFRSYYLIKHNNLNLYDYIRWDEDLITKTLLDEYKWETDPGTRTTWRIGDGTAAFYNFIYYILAGFTENDTFRSNQVREGDLTRNEAIELARSENQPRWDSIKWYSNTINVDFVNSISIITTAKPIYE